MSGSLHGDEEPVWRDDKRSNRGDINGLLQRRGARGGRSSLYDRLFDSFKNVAVNQRGDVAFVAEVGLVDRPGPIDFFEGPLFRSDRAGGTRLCASGYLLAQTVGSNVSNPSIRSRLVFEANGDIVFSGAAHGPGTVDTIARCDADSGEIEVLVQVGDELADEPGVTLTALPQSDPYLQRLMPPDG